MARESLLADHLAGLSGLGGTLDAFSPNALALYNAWTHFGVIEEETVLVANIGHETVDVILARGPDLLFARNLSGGSRLFDQAIAERFGLSEQRAEQVKREAVDLAPGARYGDANQEKASRACLAAAGQLTSLLQSTVAFCKTQVRVANLRVDRVLLCGGGAALQGLTRYLSNAMSVPVELFDPFRVVDTAGLDSESAERLEQYKLEAVVALGLATMASDSESFSVEILPAAVQRRRELLGGTAFLVAAAVLALGFLGYQGWRTSTERAQVAREVSQLDARLRRATSTDRRTRDLLAQNDDLETAASQLAAVVGSGEQIARVLDELRLALPDDFWVESLASEWRSDEGLRLPRDTERPVVHLVGRAREGTESIAAQLERFVDRLRGRFPEAELVYQASPSGDRFTLDMTLFAPPQPAAEGQAAGEAASREG
jgi:hypothetical protein